MDGKTCSKEDIKEILATALNQNIKLEFLIEEFLRTEGGECKMRTITSVICSTEK